MGKQVAVVLFSLFIGKALALQCYDCMYVVPISCSNSTYDCDKQCGSITVSVKAGGIKMDYSSLTCVDPKYCVNGRINTGVIEGSVVSKCCTTDGCNKERMPALPKQSLNGKKCCTNDDCTSTVNCEGDEDQCMNATVTLSQYNMNVKGCTTKSICTGLVPIAEESFIISSILCNDAPPV